MNHLLLFFCAILPFVISSTTEDSLLSGAAIEGEKSGVRIEGGKTGVRIHSLRKRHADPFFHRLFGFGKRNRRPKNHKEVHLHVVHPPKHHNEIHHQPKPYGGNHGPDNDGFDFHPPAWFNADEYGNPNGDGHFDFDGFGPWDEDSTKAHSHEALKPHFVKPHESHESYQDHFLPPLHVEIHEIHPHPPHPHQLPPKKHGYHKGHRPNKPMKGHFHPSAPDHDVKLRPIKVSYSHEPHGPPFSNHIPPYNYEKKPLSKMKLKKIMNNSIYRGDYPKRDKTNPNDKITPNIPPAGVSGLDPQTIEEIKDKIRPYVNTER